MTILTKCFGYEKAPLEFFYKEGMVPAEFKHTYIKHKKLDVLYAINYRFKNTVSYNQNRETIDISINHNLSTDFVLSYVNLKDEISYRIYLETIHQPLFGNIICSYVIEYVNKEQEIFQRKSNFYVEVIKGTIEKKISLIKEEFDKSCSTVLEDLINNGFNTSNNVLAYMIARYADTYLNTIGVSRIYDYSHYLKPLLIFYSMVAEDCFLTKYDNPNKLSYFMFPIHTSQLDRVAKNDNTFFYKDQADLIHNIVHFIKDNGKLIENLRRMSDVKPQEFFISEYFDYFTLKNHFTHHFNEYLINHQEQTF